MADENNPVGTGGEDMLRAAEALLGDTRERTQDTERTAAATGAAADKLQAAQAKLSSAQRKALGLIASGKGGDVPAQTVRALTRRGLLPDLDASRGARIVPKPSDLTDMGRQLAGVADAFDEAAAVVDDATRDVDRSRSRLDASERGFVDAVSANADRAAQGVADAVERAETGRQQAVVGAIQEGRRRAARRAPKVPDAPELTRDQESLLRDYLRTGDEKLRKKLVDHKVLSQTSPVGAIERSVIPRASTPAAGTSAWLKQLQEAQSRPGFNLAPSSDIMLDALRDKPLPPQIEGSSERAKAAAILHFMRPVAEQRLAALPPADLERLRNEARITDPGIAYQPGQGGKRPSTKEMLDRVVALRNELTAIARAKPVLDAETQAVERNTAAKKANVQADAAALGVKERRTTRGPKYQGVLEDSTTTTPLSKLFRERSNAQRFIEIYADAGRDAALAFEGEALAAENAARKNPPRMQTAGDVLRKDDVGLSASTVNTPETEAQVKRFNDEAARQLDEATAKAFRRQSTNFASMLRRLETGQNTGRNSEATAGAINSYLKDLAEYEERLDEKQRARLESLRERASALGFQAPRSIDDLNRELDEAIDRRVAAHRARAAKEMDVPTYKSELAYARDVEDRLEPQRRALGATTSRAQERVDLDRTTDAVKEQTQAVRENTQAKTEGERVAEQIAERLRARGANVDIVTAADTDLARQYGLPDTAFTATRKLSNESIPARYVIPDQKLTHDKLRGGPTRYLSVSDEGQVVAGQMAVSKRQLDQLIESYEREADAVREARRNLTELRAKPGVLQGEIADAMAAIDRAIALSRPPIDPAELEQLRETNLRGKTIEGLSEREGRRSGFTTTPGKLRETLAALAEVGQLPDRMLVYGDAGNREQTLREVDLTSFREATAALGGAARQIQGSRMYDEPIGPERLPGLAPMGDVGIEMDAVSRQIAERLERVKADEADYQRAVAEGRAEPVTDADVEREAARSAAEREATERARERVDLETEATDKVRERSNLPVHVPREVRGELPPGSGEPYQRGDQDFREAADSADERARAREERRARNEENVRRRAAENEARYEREKQAAEDQAERGRERYERYRQAAEEARQRRQGGDYYDPNWRDWAQGGAAAGGGGAGAPPGGPPPGGTAPPPPPGDPNRRAGMGDDEYEARMRRHWQAAADLNDVEEELGRRARANANAFQQLATAHQMSSQNLRRYGALSTEFISTAARGEATFKEWGWQMTSTAAKFAGWTAVSIPVFGALTGIQRIGEGAIASSSGVEQLGRLIENVDADSLQSSFRGLSDQFNVPIADVTDAVFRSGQVFQDQAQAIEAAKASLYSYQVGGVDVATSTRYLNAIVQGFGLSATDLTGVFDQINQAQNRFGITIENTEAGLARASGTFRNAGGSLDYLLALLVTGQRATGRSGENIGTAIQRSVGFIQRPSNQAALQAFGIDPKKGIEQTYEQAFQLAQGLQGEQLQQLATALSSPQYASYFVPILRSKGLMDRVLRETSPAASKNSAQNELESVLGQVDQQIKEIGTSLEQLGSNLGQSGLLSFLRLGLELTQGVLNVTNGLLEIYNKIPEPLRIVYGLLLQSYAVMSLMRRVNVGEAFQNRAPGLAPYFLEDSDRRTRRLTEKGLSSWVDEAANEQERASGRALRAQARVDQARPVYAMEIRDIDQRYEAEREKIQANPLMDDAQRRDAYLQAEERRTRERAAAGRRLSDLEDDAARASTEAAAATDETRQATEARARYDQELADARRSERNQAAANFARREGIAVPSVLATPTGEPIAFVDSDGKARPIPTHQYDIPIGPAVSPEQQAEFDAAYAGEAQEREAKRFRDAGRRAGSSFMGATRAWNEVRRQQGFLRATGGALGGALNRTGAAIAAGGNTLFRIASGFSAMLGPMGWLFIAASAIPAAWSALRDSEKKAQAAIDRAKGLTDDGDPLDISSRKELRGLRSDQEKMAEDERGWLETFTLRKIDPIRQAIGGDVWGGIKGGFGDLFLRGVGARELPEDTATREAEESIAEWYAMRARQINAGFENRPVPDLTQEQLQQRIDNDFAAFSSGQISLAKLRERTDVRWTEIGRSLLRTDPKGNRKMDALRGQIEERLQMAGDNTAGFIESLLDLGQITQDQLAGLEAIVSAGFASNRQERNFRVGSLLMAGQNANDTTAEGRALYAQAVTQFADGRTRMQARRDRDEALQRLRDRRERELRQSRQADWKARQLELMGDPSKGLRDTIGGQTEGKWEGTQGALRNLQETLGVDVGPLPPDPDSPMKQAARAAAEKLRTRAQGLRKKGKLTREEMDGVEKAYRDALQVIAQEQDELRRLRIEVRAGNLEAGLPRLTFLLQAAGAEVARAIRKFGRNSSEALTAIRAQQQAQESVVQEELRNIQASNSLAEAGVTAPGASQVSQIAGLQRVLAFQRAHPKVYTQGDIVETMAQIRGLEAQRAEEFIQAREDARIAGLDNSVKEARLRARFARARANAATDPLDQVILDAEARDAELEAEQTLRDRQLENLNFRHDIGRLTDEAWIAGMEKILRGMKKGTDSYRALKQDILRAKHDLDSEDQYELNLGDLKLPTLYEIKRLREQGDRAIGGPLARRDGRGGGYGGPRVIDTQRQPTRRELRENAIRSQINEVRGGTVNGDVTRISNRNTITVHVSRDVDLTKLGKVLEQATGQHLKSRARRKAMR